PDSVEGDHLSLQLTRLLGGPPDRGACSPCTGRGLASRRVATTLVGSYPTVSPLPSTSREIRRRRSPFCATFRRLSPPGSPQRPALRCPDFPRTRRPAVTQPARPIVAAVARPLHSRRRTRDSGCPPRSGGRTRRTRGTRAARPAAARGAPARACG